MEKRRVYLNNGFNSSGISISFAFSASKHSRPLSDKVKCICRLSLSPKLRTINSYSPGLVEIGVKSRMYIVTILTFFVK